MRFNIKEWQDKNVNRITESLEKNDIAKAVKLSKKYGFKPMTNKFPTQRMAEVYLYGVEITKGLPDDEQIWVYFGHYEGEEDTHLAFYTLLSWDGTSDAKFADCLKDSWWKKLRAQAN